MPVVIISRRLAERVSQYLQAQAVIEPTVRDLQYDWTLELERDAEAKALHLDKDYCQDPECPIAAVHFEHDKVVPPTSEGPEPMYSEEGVERRAELKKDSFDYILDVIYGTVDMLYLGAAVALGLKWIKNRMEEQTTDSI